MRYLLIGAALVCAGCGENPAVKKEISTLGYDVQTVEVKGHEYIIYSSCYKGNIIHSESCQCKEREAAK